MAGQWNWSIRLAYEQAPIRSKPPASSEVWSSKQPPTPCSLVFNACDSESWRLSDQFTARHDAIVVLNKCDLLAQSPAGGISTSATHGIGQRKAARPSDSSERLIARGSSAWPPGVPVLPAQSALLALALELVSAGRVQDALDLLC